LSAARLPESSAAFAEATWAEIRPYYEELAGRSLDASGVEQWLADWSQLDCLVSEAAALANFAYTSDTADPARETAQLRFGTEIGPRANEQRARLQKRLVGLGYERPGLETTVRRFRNQADLFRSENVPLAAELSRLVTGWSKAVGALSVEWDGEEKTPPQLLPYLASTDRAVRERAFRLRADAYMGQRDPFADFFDRMHSVRQQIARNAGFANFRDYTHLEKNRFDYSVADCLRFHDAVERSVLPAVTRVHDRRRKQMQLDALRPWDLEADPEARAPLHPFDSVDELVEHAGPVFQKVDPDFREYFDRMAEAELLDLPNRKGKAPGAYSASLHFRRLPLVFMNAVGVDDDVRTLLHECGHAFHSFEASRLPLLFQRHPGSEMAEVASMSMELLASPFIGEFYSDSDVRRSQAELLERIILFLPHCASVDAFQQWAYTEQGGDDRDTRERKWLELRRRFEGDAVDWTGLDRERIARWYQQPHFFSSPFYYIEYGLAQLAALQVWRNSRRDHREAVRMYRSALALGATRSLTDLFSAAGAKLVFDAPAMREIVADAEEELDRLS
jgi:oligoendopeptidase F